MVTLHIRHTTTYRYGVPVSLGPHRIMLQPRASATLRLLGMDLRIEPRATVTWTRDAADNSVATAVFTDMSDRLVIVGEATVELTAPPQAPFAIAAALSYPFQYDADARARLGALAVPHYADPTRRLSEWTRGFIHGNPTGALALLSDINNALLSWVGYQSREAEGTQSPLDSLERAWGACRDLAVLFAEAVRTLGFGARLVSGYLYNPDDAGNGAGSTHAWTEVCVPGAGWIAFDPTHRSVGGANLVPVAVGGDIAEVMPVVGSFTASAPASATMDVEVRVTRLGA